MQSATATRAATLSESYPSAALRASLTSPQSPADDAPSSSPSSSSPSFSFSPPPLAPAVAAADHGRSPVWLPPSWRVALWAMAAEAMPASRRARIATSRCLGARPAFFAAITMRSTSGHVNALIGIPGSSRSAAVAASRARVTPAFSLLGSRRSTTARVVANTWSAVLSWEGGVAGGAASISSHSAHPAACTSPTISRIGSEGSRATSSITTIRGFRFRFFSFFFFGAASSPSSPSSPSPSAAAAAFDHPHRQPSTLSAAALCAGGGGGGARRSSSPRGPSSRSGVTRVSVAAGSIDRKK